jgi:hypothetical protein
VRTGADAGFPVRGGAQNRSSGPSLLKLRTVCSGSPDQPTVRGSCNSLMYWPDRLVKCCSKSVTGRNRSVNRRRFVNGSARCATLGDRDDGAGCVDNHRQQIQRRRLVITGISNSGRCRASPGIGRRDAGYNRGCWNRLPNCFSTPRSLILLLRNAFRKFRRTLVPLTAALPPGRLRWRGSGRRLTA